MKKNLFTKKALVVALSAAMAITFIGCGKEAEEVVAEQDVQVADMAEGDAVEDLGLNAPTELGVGEKTFVFTVQFESGLAEDYIIHTDATTVDEALIENELVEGTYGEHGLMVSSVRGVELDFEETGKYWSFMIDGDYAMTGVSSTQITEGTTYSFEVAE